ncbi:MAG: T4 family baseplate hub assembly chaperone [Acidimicrobiia bacterium]
MSPGQLALDVTADVAVVTMPRGVTRGADQARRERELTLRAVGSGDEAFVLDGADAQVPSARATALIARCLAAEVDGDVVAKSLTVGDREALLLQLRRLTFGETMDAVLECPSESCGERLELEVRVGDLLVPPYDDVRDVYDVTAVCDGSSYAVEFRIPDANDLDDIAIVALGDPEAAAAELLRRCVLRTLVDGVELAAPDIPSEVRQAIETAMADRDPQADIVLELTCPACGMAFSQILDTATYFLHELDLWATRLLHEVHTLALYYHWNEQQILSMSPRRRARYLDLIADSVGRGAAR